MLWSQFNIRDRAGLPRLRSHCPGRSSTIGGKEVKLGSALVLSHLSSPQNLTQMVTCAPTGRSFRKPNATLGEKSRPNLSTCQSGRRGGYGVVTLGYCSKWLGWNFNYVLVWRHLLWLSGMIIYFKYLGLYFPLSCKTRRYSLARSSADWDGMCVDLLTISRISMSPIFFISTFLGGSNSQGCGSSFIVPSRIWSFSAGKTCLNERCFHSSARKTIEEEKKGCGLALVGGFGLDTH